MVLRHGPLAVLAVVLLTAVLPSVDAADVQQRLTGYSLSSWAEREGIPFGPVYALAQDDRGYLWLGTESALVRFDGARFLTAENLGIDGLPGGAVRAVLYEPHEGLLWVGFADRGGLIAIDVATATVRTHQLANTTVTRLAASGNGTLWAVGGGRLHSGSVNGLAEVDLSPYARGPVYHVGVDTNDRVWVGTQHGALARTPAGAFTVIADADGPVRGVSDDRMGGVWLTHATRGFVRAGDTDLAGHDFEGIGTGIYRDSRANLWIRTRGQGLWRVYQPTPGAALRTEKASVDTGLLSDGIWAVHEDTSGNIWVGTHEGLHRLTPHKVTPITTLGLVHAVARDPAGGVWVGTASGLLHVAHDAARGTDISRIASLPDVRALTLDPRGRLWMATGVGIVRIDPGGTTVDVLHPRGRPPYAVRSLATTGDGTIWAADADLGLLRLQGDRFEPAALAGGAPATGLDLAYADGQDRLWVAFTSGGLGAVSHDGRVRLVPGSAGLRVRTLAEDPAGTLWIGHDGGLARVGHHGLESVSIGDGFVDPEVTAVSIGSTGETWIAVGRVLVSFMPDALDAQRPAAAPTIPHRRYTTVDGLAGVPIAVSGNNSVTTDSSGRLWFVTGRGVTVVDPDSVGSPPRAPGGAVHIESLIADGHRLAIADTITVPAGTTRLQIDYTALQLSRATTPRFRYQLEGIDTSWVDAGTQRQSVYTNLRPGTYRFQVQAENEMREWSGPPAVLAFAVAPAFHQTGLFYLVVALALAGLALMAWNARLRILRQQFSIALAERARLSREMHDTLLQSLVGFAIQLDSVANTTAPVPETRERLLRMRRQVEGYIRDVRHSIWDLRAAAPSAGDLASTLRATGARLARGGAVFELTVEGTPRRWSRHAERGLLRIGQEAITNAVRHSGADHIAAVLQYDGDTLTLRVQDDGCGFDRAATTRPTHYGIVSMRERAAELGAAFTIASAPGHGTTVEVTLSRDGHSG